MVGAVVVGKSILTSYFSDLSSRECFRTCSLSTVFFVRPFFFLMKKFLRAGATISYVVDVCNFYLSVCY